MLWELSPRRFKRWSTAAADLQARSTTNSARFRRGNPQCRLYHVSGGRWIGDAVLEGRVTVEVQALEALGLFSAGGVEFSPVDAERLQVLYRETQHRVISEFQGGSRGATVQRV